MSERSRSSGPAAAATPAPPIAIQPRRPSINLMLSESPKASPRSPYGTPPTRPRRRSSNSSARPRLSTTKPPLSTHSPIALAAAAAVTPERLLQLLDSQGPLPIRHVTSHLATHISGFGDLSLSKQRRLIVAVLESGDPANGIVFEKVGWGRWAVQGDERARDTPEEEDELDMEGIPPPTTKVKREPRGSISSALPTHKIPLSPSLDAVENAVFSDSEEAGTDEDDWAGLMESREQDAIQALVKLGTSVERTSRPAPPATSRTSGITGTTGGSNW